jgi:SAM-dependent methyltransferase
VSQAACPRGWYVPACRNDRRETRGSTLKTEQILARSHDKNLATTWDDAHRYTPTARHRRRLILNTLAGLDFGEVLDAGCAQPYLLEEVLKRHPVPGFACDISDEVMASNQDRLPECEFRAIDLSKEAWPDGIQFDLVICSEVLEHIEDWPAAVANLVGMTRKHLLITVPGGKLRGVEKMLGHYRHYRGPELIRVLQDHGCTDVRLRRWGFPMYDLYRLLVNKVAPDKLYTAFCSERRYTLFQKVFTQVLYLLFYLSLPNAGGQVVVLARPPRPNGASPQRADAYTLATTG